MHTQVVEEALVLMEKLGKQYEEEHAKDLKDTVYYLPHEVRVCACVCVYICAYMCLCVINDSAVYLIQLTGALHQLALPPQRASTSRQQHSLHVTHL